MMFSQERKKAELAYQELQSKANELFPVAKEIGADPDADPEKVQEIYERLDKLTGLTLELHERYNERGMAEMAQKAGNLYDQSKTMKEKVEKVAEKKGIALEDEE